VPFLAERPNALLELKTKSDCIDNLIGLDPKDRTVISWSLNATAIMTTEEDRTATLDERIAAALRVQAAGYRVGFHFDPIIAHDGWEKGYREVIERVFPRLDTRRIAWVSLGSLRMTPRLKAAIRARSQPSRVLTGELVPGPDGKERAWRGLRVKMYRRMLEWLRQIDDRMPVYMCMEAPGVWDKVFGESPTDRALAQRLTARQLVAAPPQAVAR
jgi:spore photoproduct lyase